MIVPKAPLGAEGVEQTNGKPHVPDEAPRFFGLEKKLPLLNVTEIPEEIHTANRRVVGVSKDTPDLHAEPTERTDDRHYELDDQIRTRAARIERMRSTGPNSQT